MPPFKRTYKTANSGVDWDAKNYETEYSIAVSQAMNIAYAHQAGKRPPTKDEVFAIFNAILDYKLDEKFTHNFSVYYRGKGASKARALEKEEQRLEDAGPGIDDIEDNQLL